MSADSDRLLPPNNPVAFESLCLDLWKEVWDDPGAQKNGRSGQPQAGVDVFGTWRGRQMGVQCKQKDGLLRRKLTVAELNEEVKNAYLFKPELHTFILASSGPSDVKVQERAREITAEHAPHGLFGVEVWSWEDIWRELYGRQELLKRILPIYWRLWAMLQDGSRIVPSKLTHVPETLIGRHDELADLDAAWKDSEIHVVTLVAWGGVGKPSLVGKWAAELARRNYDDADYFDWSFYSQGTKEEGGASADAFVAAALKWFGDAEMAESAASPWDKGVRVAQLYELGLSASDAEVVEQLHAAPAR